MNCGHGGCNETIHYETYISHVFDERRPISTRDGVFDFRMSPIIIRNGVSNAKYSQHSSETAFSVAKYHHLS